MHFTNVVMTNEVSPIDTWLAQGREIAAQRLSYDWLMADWMAEGKAAGHLSRLKYNFLSECVGLTPRRLKDALKVAVTFPPDTASFRRGRGNAAKSRKTSSFLKERWLGKSGQRG